MPVAYNFFLYLRAPKHSGIRMQIPDYMLLERWPSWSMAHAWKVCIPQKGIMGSNPILSAENKIAPL